MRLLLFVAALLAPALVSAQAVYKCRNAKGEAVYQSQPCEGGKLPEKAWSGDYRQPTNAELWQRYLIDQRWQQQQQAERSRTSTASFVGSVPRFDQRESRCSIAKAERARTLDRVGLKRTYDLLSRLDAMVYEACK